MKSIKALIKLQLPAGKANPSPPVGPALGQHGVNIMSFCKAFNDKTKDKGDSIIPVVITVYKDRTFNFITKVPPVSSLIKKALSLNKGAANSVLQKIATLTKSQVEDIAKIKMPDLNARKIESAINIVKGTARSMGVEVE